jgi:hypothetical protein
MVYVCLSHFACIFLNSANEPDVQASFLGLPPAVVGEEKVAGDTPHPRQGACKAPWIPELKRHKVVRSSI